MFTSQSSFGVPSTRVPVSIASFLLYIFPPVVCYVAAAFLAVTPQTRAFRVALWPVIALLAMRAALSVDLSLGNPEIKPINFCLVLSMITITFHSLSWMFLEKPPVRYLRPANRSPSNTEDAIDLLTNFRGIGWEWSRGLYIPRETRPTNRMLFVLYTLLSAISYGLLSDLLQEAIKSFCAGTTIFDESLAFSLRYFRACIISTLAGVAAHVGLQALYDILTLIGIVLVGQDPAQWPPVIKNPWGATSLIDFWGHRWHQLFRNIFLVGAYPFTAAFGRAGTIIGAFLTSGLMHHLMLTLLDSKPDMWKMLVGFGMMGPLVLVEREFYRLTGRKVGGVVGWIWTMTWIIVLGNFMVDGFMGARLFTLPNPAGRQWPTRVWTRRLVTDFDAWLHSI